jgi:hypothetical protein
MPLCGFKTKKLMLALYVVADVCVYKGKQYFQRQSWRDGCDYQCTCTDAKSGLYRCEDL